MKYFILLVLLCVSMSGCGEKADVFTVTPEKTRLLGNVETPLNRLQKTLTQERRSI